MPRAGDRVLRRRRAGRRELPGDRGRLDGVRARAAVGLPVARDKRHQVVVRPLDRGRPRASGVPAVGAVVGPASTPTVIAAAGPGSDFPAAVTNTSVTVCGPLSTPLPAARARAGATPGRRAGADQRAGALERDAGVAAAAATARPRTVVPAIASPPLDGELHAVLDGQQRLAGEHVGADRFPVALAVDARAELAGVGADGDVGLVQRRVRGVERDRAPQPCPRGTGRSTPSSTLA